MEIGNIVTINNNEKYYLVDKTSQNNKNYFLASKLDLTNSAKDATEIFEELVNNKGTFLIPVKDENLFNYLSAIFIEKFTDLVDEEI